MQLSQVDVDIPAARRQVIDQDDKITQLRKMINTAPEVEARVLAPEPRL